MTLDKNLPEGILRSGLTTDGIHLRVEYTEAHDYELGGRFQWIARVTSLDLALAMFEACSLATWNDSRALSRHVRTEMKRAASVRFESPARKEWYVINCALNRLEGKRLKMLGRNNRRIEQWV